MASTKPEPCNTIFKLFSTASGNTEILKFLLDHLTDKKDVDVTDNINATPAHDAAEYGQIKTMLLLLKYGADVRIADTVSEDA